jgi:uncharacterized protein (TIGR03546 family)
VLRANITMAFVGAAIAVAVAWLLDPVLNALGAAVLGAGPLRGLFTTLYNSPPWSITRFNNTVVMGASLAAVVTAIVLFPLTVRGVRLYRERLLERVARLRVVQVLKGTKLFSLVQRLQDLGLI